MIKNFSKKKGGKKRRNLGGKNIQSRKHLYAFLHKRAYYLEKHFLYISKGHTDENVFERQREIFPIFRDACGNEFSNFSCIFNVFAWIHQILGSLSITEIVARIYVRNVFRYPYKIFTSFLRVSRWRSSSHGDTYSNLLFIEFTFLLTVISNVVKEFFFFVSFSIL